MAIGNARNRYCPNGHVKIRKVRGINREYVEKYKRCCFDKDYWYGFSVIVTKQKDDKTGIEREIKKYIRRADK